MSDSVLSAWPNFLIGHQGTRTSFCVFTYMHGNVLPLAPATVGREFRFGRAIHPTSTRPLDQLGHLIECVLELFGESVRQRLERSRSCLSGLLFIVGHGETSEKGRSWNRRQWLIHLSYAKLKRLAHRLSFALKAQRRTEVDRAASKLLSQSGGRLTASLEREIFRKVFASDGACRSSGPIKCAELIRRAIPFSAQPIDNRSDPIRSAMVKPEAKLLLSTTL
jgi:hypothetical protein